MPKITSLLWFMLLRQDSYTQLMIISCNDHPFSTLFISLETSLFFLLIQNQHKTKKITLIFFFKCIESLCSQKFRP